MNEVSGASLLRTLRERAGLTQSRLAALAGISQPKLSAYERGLVTPKPETLERIVAAAKPRPSEMLERNAEAVRALARTHHISHVRVFGSSVNGTDTQHSDVDLLVTLEPSASLFDLTGFEIDVSGLLGYPVDVISDGVARDRIMDRILAEAVPL